MLSLLLSHQNAAPLSFSKLLQLPAQLLVLVVPLQLSVESALAKDVQSIARIYPAVVGLTIAVPINSTRIVPDSGTYFF